MRTFIFGAGAHGRIALDILRVSGMNDVAFVDDRPDARGTTVNGAPVLGYEDLLAARGDPHGAVVAIGKPSVRRAVAERLAPDRVALTSAIPPRATILPTAPIAPGPLIGPS